MSGQQKQWVPIPPRFPRGQQVEWPREEGLEDYQPKFPTYAAPYASIMLRWSGSGSRAETMWSIRCLSRGRVEMAVIVGTLLTTLRLCTVLYLKEGSW